MNSETMTKERTMQCSVAHREPGQNSGQHPKASIFLDFPCVMLTGGAWPGCSVEKFEFSLFKPFQTLP